MGKRGGGRSRMTFIKHATEIINADIFGAKKRAAGDIHQWKEVSRCFTDEILDGNWSYYNVN